MIARILILSLSLWLSGCTIAGKSPPSRFYILPGPEAARPMSRIKLVIAIAPVRLPKYLHRPQIVTVRRDGVIELAEFHRWAEPLTAGFTRVLRAGLANRLPQSHVVILPAPRSRPDWLIETRVHEFQVHPKHCILQADWRLIRGTRI
ncbi:MAG TPA: membrane integrity-associated transporter subunit PqiC, partial [Methylothermaceae bacterium]|nr:membrane integrity-associated transporter subunit PqiC [Methylothermaceae bacterium]